MPKQLINKKKKVLYSRGHRYTDIQYGHTKLSFNNVIINNIPTHFIETNIGIRYYGLCLKNTLLYPKN